MQCAVEKFVQLKENGLCLIDMPTGTGKTYLTRQIIDRFIRGEILNEISTIIYLTPQKKNIDDIYDKLREGFQGNLSLFDSKVLRIYANYECVVDKFLTLYEKFPSNIKGWDSCKELKKQIECYHSLKERNLPKEIIDSTLSEIRKTYEIAFRKDLSEELYKDHRTLTARKKKLNSKEFTWVKELYPACLTDDRSVLFMTMDKFFSGNDPIISKSYRFISHSKTKGALVFIDEFDATKDVLLNQEIQNCTDYKMDLIKLFSSISNTLKGREFPTSIFANSLDENDKNSSLSRFNKLKAHFLDVEKKYNLNYLFKLDAKGETDRYFLFDDYQLHTITNAKTEKNIILKEDKKKRQNTITISNENDKGKFYRTIYAIKNAINLFINCSSVMAKNYLQHYNDEARANNSDMMEIEQAVSTIIDPYNLDYVLAKNLTAMIVDNISIPVINRGRDVFDTDFYMNGFRYYDFKDDITHNESTTMMMCYLDNTPEKYILSLASKARVIGLSATASIETVTGNYNIEYLRDRLNEDYYELPIDDKQRIDSYIDERLNNSLSSDINVQVEAIENYDDKLENIIAQLFKQSENIEKISGLLSHFEQNTEWENQDPFFDIKRVIRAMKAIRAYLSSSTAKVMLVMTNKNVKNDSGYDIFSRDILEQIIGSLCEELNVGKPSSFYLQSVGFADQKDNYKKAIQCGERVIIFSSYQTAGTGQNLQYEIDEQEKDIDSLYLELPTNILVNAQKLKEEKDLIKLIYQYEALKTSGEVSKNISLNNIKVAFRKLMTSKLFERIENYAYNTDSVNNHKLKILIQAVGRICRTKNKGDIINIFVDEEIIKNINFSVIKGRKLNLEFKRIAEIGTQTEKQVNSTHRNLNKACDSNARVKTRIENMLNENRTVWSGDDIAQWERMRDFVLKYPTISKKDFDKEIKSLYSIKDFYLEAKEGEKIDHYIYINDENEAKPILYDLSASRREKGIVINDRGTRLNSLIRIPAVKKVFVENGYAMMFEKNDFIILPVVYQNIYKGALGEVAGRAILESKGIKLSAITDATKFEKFDYCLSENKDVYVDFKNWSENDAVSSAQYKEKCFSKLQKIGGKAVFVINVAASSFQIHKSYNNQVIEISTLCKSRNHDLLYELDSFEMGKIIDSFKEIMYGNL